MAFEYRKQIELEMGRALPDMDDDLAPHVETEVARAAAAASDKLLKKNQDEKKAQDNLAAQNDPVVQLQMRDMALKEGEFQLRQKRLAVDAARYADDQKHKEQLDAARLQLDAFKAGSKVAVDQAKIDADLQKAGLQQGVQIAATQARIDADLHKRGVEIGVDIAKTQAAAATAARKDQLDRQGEENGRAGTAPQET